MVKFRNQKYLLKFRLDKLYITYTQHCWKTPLNNIPGRKPLIALLGENLQ